MEILVLRRMRIKKKLRGMFLFVRQSSFGLSREEEWNQHRTKPERSFVIHEEPYKKWFSKMVLRRRR